MIGFPGMTPEMALEYVENTKKASATLDATKAYYDGIVQAIANNAGLELAVEDKSNALGAALGFAQLAMGACVKQVASSEKMIKEYEQLYEDLKKQAEEAKTESATEEQTNG